MKKEKEEKVKEEGTFKIKKRPSMKELIKKDEPIKVDLSKFKKDAIQESGSDDSDVVVEGSKNTESSKMVVEVIRPTEESKQEETGEKEIVETPIIAEIKEEEFETIGETIGETIESTKEVVEEHQKIPRIELPENIEKLVDFMRETGGNMTDYIRLNADYSTVDNNILLKEYYTQTKPHLDDEEIQFIMDDKFKWDKEYDEERDIKKKKLALKEEVAEAKGYLEGLKSKYYEDLKLRPSTTNEQKKATDFFNRHNEEQEIVQQRRDTFKSSTKDYFTNDFKGFDFDLGEKKFRYGVNNPTDVATNQSDLNDFVKKFLDEKGNISDYKGYHKAIYAARNADTIAKHFYDQGKSDAVKDITAKSKNINNEPRSTASGDVFVNGLKVRAINGVDSSKLKFKKKINN
jgi:hypothetical protein